ncbi:H-2 class II histocompatibility antigen, E-S beta chain-like [Eublepharis macularius]|uniref:H-2 class II histocompatibility antigen, E-S beta chain-like n=1 Tax=Eublepharis macularius TaxID=481883 RepID=A0AA97J6V1_EUBMA|nr:H-2 class II histocompatibility antigen, E-S beta chain-like [Eublepharis macularius]
MEQKADSSPLRAGGRRSGPEAGEGLLHGPSSPPPPLPPQPPSSCTRPRHPEGRRGPPPAAPEAECVCVGGLLLHGFSLPSSPPAAAQFLHQHKPECRFANGTRGEVRFLDRYFYDRQELVRFDSRRGTYEALTELGRPDADYWNSQKERLDNRRGEVERFCRYNYQAWEGILTTKAQPTVKISFTKAEPLSHPSLLICTAAGYYPSEINFKWLKNGQEQTEGLGYSEEFQNGDWTFMNQVMLETVPERGDVYTCQVEHSSLTEPITVQWEPRRSDSAKSKVWTGSMGGLLGAVFVAVGLALYLKKRKALPATPAAVLWGSFIACPKLEEKQEATSPNRENLRRESG